MNRTRRLVTTNFAFGLDLSDDTLTALQAAADRKRAREQAKRIVPTHRATSLEEHLRAKGAK